MLKNIKRVLFAGLIALGAIGLTGYERATVPAGYVGVKVDLYGDEKGVQQQEVGVGKYWLTERRDLSVPDIQPVEQLRSAVQLPDQGFHDGIR